MAETTELAEVIDPLDGEIIDQKGLAKLLLAQAKELGREPGRPGGLLSGLTKQGVMSVTSPLRGLAGSVRGGLQSLKISLRETVGKSAYARNASRMPILSRLYGPSLFGEFGLFSATAGIINGFVCLGLISAIVTPKEEEEASAIYRICILSVVSIATLLVGTCIVLSPYLRGD